MLNIEDSYQVSCGFQNIELQTLILLYQPLIGKEALSFYLTCQAGSENKVMSHQYLSTLLNMGIQDLENARKKCEEFQLVRTFLKDENTRRVYIYHCLEPKNAMEFFNHEVYGRLLLKNIGQEYFQQLKLRLLANEIDTSKLLEVTNRLNQKQLATWDVAKEVEYNKIQNTNQHIGTLDNMNFDYQKLLQGATVLTFPIEARTAENLQLIGELAQLHGISEERMKILVSRAVNLSDSRLDLKRLKNLCLTEEPSVSDNVSQDPYLLAPAKFLQSKQNGIPVTPGDRELLNYLGVDMKMTPVVINIFIEYVLENNENSLAKRYVQTVASQWARSGVKTKEQALEMTKKKNQYRPAMTKTVLPDYLQQAQRVESREISDEEREKLMKLFEEVGE
ncbi:MAG: DnaD domain protein [Anaerorhabdus sp.]